jgi:hypothetical protein
MLGRDKAKDSYPAGWEQMCKDERGHAVSWYIEKYGVKPVIPLVDVELVNETTGPYWGLITYNEPRYLIQIWADAPRRETLFHEFKHALMMRNRGDGSEGGIRRRK